MDNNEVLQAIRRSHCAKSEEEHPCQGSIKITRDGYELDCSLCGGSKEKIGPSGREDVYKRLKDIFNQAGVDFEKIGPEYQAQAIKEYLLTNCPGCGKQMPCKLFGHESYYSCECKQYIFSHWRGWHKPDITQPAI